MYLQKLVIQGFKSFANKSELEFTPGVTAIVGPNGSGKSNIADSVRWVLGEQSLKTLRGKKSEDVIFAGSDKKTRLGYCQVDLHLNNEDRTAPVDYQEIVISRKVYRDGEGEYFINKNRVRLQDILMLLAKSNFGQRSYSIISQGTVDLFLAATPLQRKEYFDEAAGVRQFQIKKEQAEHKLALTKDNLYQADLLTQEIEPRLRSLTRQVRRLERREEVTKELKELQHTYYGGLWHDLKNKREHEQQQYNLAELKQHEAETALQEIQNNMQQLALGSTRQEEFQQLQREYDTVITRKNALLKDQAVLKGRTEADREQRGEFDLVWLERKQEQLAHETNALATSIKEFKTEEERHTDQLKVKERELKEQDMQHVALSNKLRMAKEKLQQKKSIALPDLAREIEDIYNRFNGLLEKINAAATIEEVKVLRADLKTLVTELAQLNHRLGGSNAGDPRDVIELQDAIAELLSAKDALLTTINDFRVKIQVSQERVSLNQRQLQSVEQEREKVKNELQRLTTRISASERAANILKEEQQLNQQIKQIDSSLADINRKLEKFNHEEQKKKEEVFALQTTFSKKQEELNRITAGLNDIRVEIAKVETKQEDIEREMVDELADDERNSIFQLKNPPAPQPPLFQDIQKLKHHLELIGGIDPQVSKEYEETQKRFDFLTHQSTDLRKAIEDLEEAIESLDETIKKQFSKAFEQINKQFTEYFKVLFNGGNATLTLVKEEPRSPETDEADGEDGEDVDEAESKPAAVPEPKPILHKEKIITGIDVHATPPGKRLRGISMLSGGERALTSIALICAIIHNNPSPFVILDEVDAALDESNSIRFASIVERLSKRSQFIVITHNRATMNKARILYGVTMGDDGVSKLLSINIQEAEKVIAEA
ncbi:MAG: AAA family ATPase [Patescibacteria group bacterium]|nr:AAA family ATPase [Patescibacteria group bacterium]MDD5715550.1 AAA family ATPase [Patescibacteria group bacterium]